MNRILTFSILLAVAPLAVAQRTGESRPGVDQIPPILRQAIRKMSSVRFSGTRTVEVLEGSNRERHVEYVLRDGPRTRTWFPSASPYAGQVIVETPRERRHYYPGRNEIYVTPPRREEAVARLMRLGRRSGIRVTVKDGPAIAERPTVQVSLLEGSGNPIQHLWIDREQAVILKRELFDAVGTRVGFFEFTDIDYRPRINPGDFELDRKGAKVVTPVDQLARLAKQGGLNAVRLPDSEGYRLEWVRRLPGGRVTVIQQAYSKGDVSLSFFHAGAEVNLPMLRRTQKGFESFSWTQQGNTYALLGNVGADELRRLARLLGYR